MTTIKEYKAMMEGATDALLNYQQADMDGCMVLVSRQAIHEIVDYIKYIHSNNLVMQKGCVSVPKAPSEKQIDAALDYCDGYNSKYFLGLYKVMITAAQEE